MTSAYEHGWNAARRGKHIQACPFDSGTAEWQQWRDGFIISARRRMQEASAIMRGAPLSFERLGSGRYDAPHESLVANTTTSLQRNVGNGEGKLGLILALIARGSHL